MSRNIDYIYYAYPDAASGADANFYEIYGSISMGGFSASVFATSAASSDGTEMALHLGHYSGDFIGDDDIIDYGVSISKDGFTSGLSRTNMDYSDIKAYVAFSMDFSL